MKSYKFLTEFRLSIVSVRSQKKVKLPLKLQFIIITNFFYIFSISHKKKDIFLKNSHKNKITGKTTTRPDPTRPNTTRRKRGMLSVLSTSTLQNITLSTLKPLKKEKINKKTLLLHSLASSSSSHFYHNTSIAKSNKHQDSSFNLNPIIPPPKKPTFNGFYLHK